MKRYLSRKFIATAAAQVAALLVLVWPQHEATILASVEAVAALAVALGSALGYVAAESSIDRKRAGQTPSETARLDDR